MFTDLFGSKASAQEADASIFDFKVKSLEGKEVDVKIGSIGSVSVDITPDLHLEVALSAKIDLFGEMLKMAMKAFNFIIIGGSPEASHNSMNFNNNLFKFR